MMEEGSTVTSTCSLVLCAAPHIPFINKICPTNQWANRILCAGKKELPLLHCCIAVELTACYAKREVKVLQVFENV